MVEGEIRGALSGETTQGDGTTSDWLTPIDFIVNPYHRNQRNSHLYQGKGFLKSCPQYLIGASTSNCAQTAARSKATQFEIGRMPLLGGALRLDVVPTLPERCEFIKPQFLQDP